MALITCADVSFAYENTSVISGLNFTVEKGDYICVVGENGSGKSTLIRGLVRLKAPASGSIELGEGLSSTQIGYLPQQTAAQRDFPASVWEVILSGNQGQRGWKPFYRREDKARAEDMLSSLNLSDLRNRCFRELSGGQQRRVLLARALCATQTLLLLDEPVTGLDPMVTAEFYHLLNHINQEKGITVVMVSHDIPSAVKYANHILHLGTHSQLFFGTTAEYLRSDVGRRFTGGALE